MTGTYPSVPRLPPVTLEEAREAVRLHLHFSDTGDGASDEDLDAYALATDLAGRLPWG